MANVEGTDYNIKEFRNKLNAALAGNDDALAWCFGLNVLSGTVTRKSYVLNKELNIPITSFVDADGDPLAKFVSESQPSFGFNLADSESLCLRWNNHATPGTALCSVAIPDDLDDDANATLTLLLSKSGATSADAPTIAVTAFIISAGDLHDADADCGSSTSAFTGTTVAKTTVTKSITLTAANIPSGTNRKLTFTLTPEAGKLGTDDLMLHSCKLVYRAKPDIT